LSFKLHILLKHVIFTRWLGLIKNALGWVIGKGLGRVWTSGNRHLNIKYKKIIRKWDSERELSLRLHRARTTKYNRLVNKFRHRSTRLFVRTQVY